MDTADLQSEPRIGLQIKRLRSTQSVTLAELAEAAGLSEATLSRIENGHSEISAHNLYKVAARLGSDVTAFFASDAAPLNIGVRSLSRRGTAPRFETPSFVAEVLCPDVSPKAMQPFVNTVTAQTLEQAGGCQPHAGEEFLHVLEGRLILHSTLYAPLLMEPGDSLYFSGTMPHAYVCAEGVPTRILVVTTEPSTPLPSAALSSD